MKKIFLFLFLITAVVSISYADYRDDFPDESICLFLNKKPVNPYYVDAAEKRGITCSGGNLISKNSPDLITNNEEESALS